MIVLSYVLVRHTDKGDTRQVVVSVSDVVHAVTTCLVEGGGVPREEAVRFARLLVKAPRNTYVSHPCGYAFTLSVNDEHM
jgi:hypothetical protein